MVLCVGVCYEAQGSPRQKQGDRHLRTAACRWNFRCCRLQGPVSGCSLKDAGVAIRHCQFRNLTGLREGQ